MSNVKTVIEKSVSAVSEFNRAQLLPTQTDHPFLTGAHAPMDAEKTIVDLEVTGTIPPGLEGRYLRIGPNPIAPDPAGYNWFTGDGMVHGLALEGGRALWYRNRWVRSKRVSERLGEPASPGPRHGPTDTVNTNIIGMNGRTWALVESGAYPVEMSELLENQVHNPFDGTLKGAFSAHPHRDPVTGEFHAITYQTGVRDDIFHVVLSAEGKVIREKRIPVSDGPSIHDCALTARYAIILDLSVTFSEKAIAAGYRFPFEWNPQHPSRVGLLPREGSAEDVIWCDVDPCYVYHVANAYDREDGSIVLDVVAYDTMFASSLDGPDASGRFERWTITPAAKSVERVVIDANWVEFPRLDERRFGQRYRYAYAISLEEGSTSFGAANEIYKYDLESGTRVAHQFGKGRHPGEFVFVPKAADSAEDDGWMMGLVVDLENKTTDLVILDALDFAGPAVASVRIPHLVPGGFHGNWLAS